MSPHVTPPRLIEAVVVLLGYIAVASLLYQTPLFSHATSLGAGLGLPDNNAYVWMLAWPAHAIADGLSLFHPNIIFVPEGYNLARATPMFTFGILLAPLTALSGPIVTYNVVMLLVPALNGSTAYALCRRLGASPGPAALGGFVFATSGIVSFAELGAPSTACGAFIALAVLLILNLLGGHQPRWRTAVWLGLDLIAQLYCSAELLVTFLLFGVLALIITWTLAARQRDKMRRALPKLAGAGAILTVGGLPYMWSFALDQGIALTHVNPALYPNDLLGFVVPSPLFRFGRSYFSSLSATFIGEASEAYVGIGLLVITVWYFAERWRTEVGARILGVTMVVLTVCSLGTNLTIAGHKTIPMPWDILVHAPLLRYALPSRLSLLLTLGVAVVVAMWLSRRSGVLRWIVALGSCALLIPNSSVSWSSSFHTPRFFVSGAATRLFTSHDHVLVVPFAGPDEEAQAESGFAFSLVGGYLGQYPPSYGNYPAVTDLIERASPPGAPAQVTQFVRDKHVDAVVVDEDAPGPWTQLFSGLGVQPVTREGVLIYMLAPR
ncbi:MAG: hypothetical protein WBV77_12570 [Solirubrobacteraceae bacterium]